MSLHETEETVRADSGHKENTRNSAWDRLSLTLSTRHSSGNFKQAVGYISLQRKNEAGKKKV